MNLMMRILHDLVPLNRVICSTDYDKTIAYLQNILPFEIIAFPASEEYNGWVIPPKWDVKEAKIIKNGKVIYDGKWHALAVIALSRSFRGRVSIEELKRHLHYDHRCEDSLTFHFRQQFRSWNRDWGFCVPKVFYDGLTEGEYEVIIETKEDDGVLKILDYTHKGAITETIAICANLDHPGVANDGLAGVVVGIELMRRLAGKRTKFSYRLVLAQGIMGTEYYLGKMNKESREKIIECLCLWMLGSRTKMALQKSREACSNIEDAMARVMNERHIPYWHEEFERIIINDEYIWEAYGIPACSISRMPYPEYHSSRDNMSIMSEAALAEAVDILEGAVKFLESSELVYKKFEGNVCLSNPRYDLYVDPGQTSFGEKPTDESKKMRRLMDLIPSLRKPVTMRSLADKVDLEEGTVAAYLSKWANKGLLEIK